MVKEKMANQKAKNPNSGKMTEAEIDTNVAGSFPASDPPSWTLGLKPEDTKDKNSTITKDEQNIVQIQQKISGLCQELHTKANNLQSPQGKALLETSAEVMDGINKAFDHFLAKSEGAWKS
jgi:hypothetical protein